MAPEEPLLGQLKEAEKKAYQELVKEVKPRPPVLRNALFAFGVGGAICAGGQLFSFLFQRWGLAAQEANTAALLVLVFLGAFLTGLGVYDCLVQFGGAGGIIPITGFANSIVSPAMEFRREGLVFGTCARMFTVAGPVLVYGFVTAVIIGLVFALASR